MGDQQRPNLGLPRLRTGPYDGVTHKSIAATKGCLFFDLLDRDRYSAPRLTVDS